MSDDERHLDDRLRAPIAEALRAALDIADDGTAPLGARERAVEIVDCLAEESADESVTTRMLRMLEEHADEELLLPLVSTVRCVLRRRCFRPLGRLAARAHERGHFALLARIVEELLALGDWDEEFVVTDGWGESAVRQATCWLRHASSTCG